MLRNKFKSEITNLTDAEIRILDTIDEQIALIDNFSISNIANITYSSTTSINRLVKKLGYTYSDFKFLLHSLKENNIITNSKSIDSPSIYINGNTLSTVTSHINKANTIYILGVGQSAHISRYFYDILFKMGYNCHIITDADLILSLMRKIDNTDYIIYISSSGNTSTLVNAAKTNNTTNSLAITSSEDCKLAKFTTEIMCSNSDLISHKSYSFSLQGGLMQIIDGIIVSLLTNYRD